MQVIHVVMVQSNETDSDMPLMAWTEPAAAAQHAEDEGGQVVEVVLMGPARTHCARALVS